MIPYICPRCNHEVPGDADFCGNCGLSMLNIQSSDNIIDDDLDSDYPCPPTSSYEDDTEEKSIKRTVQSFIMRWEESSKKRIQNYIFPKIIIWIPFVLFAFAMILSIIINYWADLTFILHKYINIRFILFIWDTVSAILTMDLFYSLIAGIIIFISPAILMLGFITSGFPSISLYKKIYKWSINSNISIISSIETSLNSKINTKSRKEIKSHFQGLDICLSTIMYNENIQFRIEYIVISVAKCILSTLSCLGYTWYIINWLVNLEKINISGVLVPNIDTLDHRVIIIAILSFIVVIFLLIVNILEKNLYYMSQHKWLKNNLPNCADNLKPNI